MDPQASHGLGAASRAGDNSPFPGPTKTFVALLATLPRRPDRPRLPMTEIHHRIEREARPPMRVLAAGVDPPNCLGKWPLADRAALRTSRSGAVLPDRGHASFRALLR